MPGRQPRFFPLESPDMERAGTDKMKIVYKRKKEEDSDCGCKMCTQIFWTPMSILCLIPPCNLCRDICIA